MHYLQLDPQERESLAHAIGPTNDPFLDDIRDELANGPLTSRIVIDLTDGVRVFSDGPIPDITVIKGLEISTPQRRHDVAAVARVAACLSLQIGAAPYLRTLTRELEILGFHCAGMGASRRDTLSTLRDMQETIANAIAEIDCQTPAEA